MPLPVAYVWFMSHPLWVLITVALLGVVALRASESRSHVVRSVLFAAVLLAVSFSLSYTAAWLPAQISPALAAGLLDIAFGLLFIRIWGGILFRLILPALTVSPPGIIADIVILLSYAFWIALGLHRAGMALGEIVTTSAVITAVIAFALQDTLGNLLAGIAIQLDNSVSVGDWIQHEGMAGRVSEINWRATSLETRNWETVVIPNSLLLKNRFVVLGKRRKAPLQWRRWVWFDLTLETLPSQILSMINKSLAETRIPHVARAPAANCILMDIEHGVARFAVRYWLTDLAEDDPTDSAIRTLIDATLRRNERRLTPPIFNVLMTKEKEQIHARHKRHTNERIAHLQRLSLFGMLEEDELLSLADSLKFAPYVAGDTMLEQGEVAQWLFIIVSGEAEMKMKDSEGRKLVLGTLGTGEVFGEMGLLTGEASLYSVKALRDVECYRLNREMFQSIFMKQEELVQQLSNALHYRLREQQLLLENMAVEVDRPPVGDLMAKLRSFFSVD